MRITTYSMALDDNWHPILIKERSQNNPQIQNLCDAQNVVKLLKECYQLHRKAEEHLYLICVNIKNLPLGIFEVSHGNADVTLCDPRTVFMRAMLIGAHSIILAHNHPSGDLTPSEKDMDTARCMAECGKFLNIPLLDNLILTQTDYFSFYQNNLIKNA